MFDGRSLEEIRFTPGDIVEILGLDEVHLAFVAGVPASREEAMRINDDALFTPRFKIPGPIRRRIE